MATLGALEYLISVNSSGVKSGIDKAEREVKSSGNRVDRQLNDFGNKISAWTVAKGQMIARFAETALQKTTTVMKNTIKGAVDAYAEFEQLEGGAKLLFGSGFEKIMDNAAKAFETVQMSANDYLDAVNGYAVGLKNSLNGDEKAAADLADKIITAQADIVAATGKSRESVQNAFAGVMRGNYMMLDNLGLGIKGSKEGMEDVIKSVNEWHKANKRTTKYMMGNLADMENALVDYVEMQGLAGYAGKEAADTLEGTMASTKAAWQNLLVALGSGKDVKKATRNFGRTLTQTVKNIRPVVLNAIHGIFESAKVLFPELKALFKETFTAVKLQVADWLDLGSDASWIDIGIKLAGKIKSGAKSSLIDWLDLGADASWFEIGLNVLAKVKKGAKTTLIDLFGLKDSNGDKLGDDATWGNVGTSIAEKLSESLSDGGWLNTALNDAAKNLDAITKIATQLMEGIATWITNNSDKFVGIVTNLVKALGKVLPEIASALSELLGNSEVQEAIKNLFVAGIQAAYDLLVSLMESIGDIVGKAIFGDEWYEMKKKEENRVLTDTGSVKEGDDDWNKVAEAIDEKHQMRVTADTDFAGGIADEYGATLTHLGVMPWPWETIEKSSLDSLVKLRKSASEIGNAGLYEMATAGLRAAGDAYKSGLRGDDFTNAIKESMEAIGEQTIDLTTEFKAGTGAKIQQYLDGLGATVPVTVRVYDENGVERGVDYGNYDGGGGGHGFAKGNWNVPYDNYPALLHRNEMVLTASQARRYRDGEMNADYGIIGEMIGTAINQSMKKVYVMMSGEKVGDLTTKRVRKNINASSYSKTRAMGG